MKKYISINIYKVITAFTLFFACLSGHSQSLSFSRVLLLSNIEDTVHTGKVWKVESIVTNSGFQITGGSSCSQDIDMRQIFLNGVSRYLQSTSVSYGGGTVFFSGDAFPLWLPAGTRLRTNCSSATLSIIEFTVTP